MLFQFLAGCPGLLGVAGRLAKLTGVAGRLAKLPGGGGRLTKL